MSTGDMEVMEAPVSLSPRQVPPKPEYLDQEQVQLRHEESEIVQAIGA